MIIAGDKPLYIKYVRTQRKAVPTNPLHYIIKFCPSWVRFGTVMLRTEFTGVLTEVYIRLTNSRVWALVILF